MSVTEPFSSVPSLPFSRRWPLIALRRRRSTLTPPPSAIRRGDNVDAALLAKVPSVTRVNEVMSGRRLTSALETHHTATVKWVRALRPGITQADLDEMPALLLDIAFHRDPDGDLIGSGYQAFHRILDRRMEGVDSTDTAAILVRLRDTYREFYHVTDPAAPDPDVWLVARKWLEKKGS